MYVCMHIFRHDFDPYNLANCNMVVVIIDDLDNSIDYE